MKNKVNEITVSYKERVSATFWKEIKSSEDASKMLFEHWNKNTIGLHESFKIVLLNNSNKVKGIYQLSQGGITATLIDLRILFGVVLKTVSTGIILCHNHPSAKLKPSIQDIEITNKIKKAAALFDIKLLDHLILSPDGKYYSFSDNGDL